MDRTDAIDDIKKEIFTRQDIFETVHSIDNTFRETQMRNLMEQLLARGTIVRVGRNMYSKNQNKKKFSAELSGDAKEIKFLLKEKYPYLQFQIWEMTCLNEFLNHLIAHNRIFVDTENDSCESVYTALADRYNGRVLLKPTEKELSYYCGENSIIIDRLVGEYPIDTRDAHEIRLEKIVVDLFSNKILQSMVSKGDYPELLNRMFEKYIINQNTLFRYARRRNKADEIAEYIKNNTDVKLLVEV